MAKAPLDNIEIDSTAVRATKKLKISHATSSSDVQELIAHFAPSLLTPPTVDRLKNEYAASGPYKHAVLDALFSNELLRAVKDECLNELSFTEKQTDIYKVNQTGDLASLSYLPEADLAKLKSLHTLRDALYSKQFRDFLVQVTGCGPLSGTKTDMSVNSYKQGCHLLNHDDVIGTRRISYILYMPLPSSQPWQASWGGALELYPTTLNPETGIEEPLCAPSKVIPPAWNQFVFFEVQPGKSFHSVEEVVVDGGDAENGEERQRLSISGWFHAAQEGEEGYEPDAKSEAKSSLEQLTTSTTTFKEYPSDDLPDLDMENLALSSADKRFLSAFLNPSYLQPSTLGDLRRKFMDDSSVELHSFLRPELATVLESGLRTRDLKDGITSPERGTKILPHGTGLEEGGGWTVRGPPHKARYCVLKDPSKPLNIDDLLKPTDTPASAEDLLACIQSTLFPSPAFRVWITIVCALIPVSYAVEARRFRPGLDYTLAKGDDAEEFRLDVALGLTPSPESNVEKSKNVDEEESLSGWESGEWGGWECYMAPHDGDDDPAVYRSGSSKKKPVGDKENGNSADQVPKSTNGEKKVEDDGDEEDNGGNDDDDGTLLTVQPGFNRLLLALRDQGTLRFVKYVSSAAQGSRWDVYCEMTAGMMVIEKMEDEDGDSGDS